MGNRPSVARVLDDARAIVKVFSRNIRPNALLKEQQKQLKVKKGLAMDCATRFSSKHSMLQSVLVNKDPLKSTVVLDTFPLSEPRCARGNAASAVISPNSLLLSYWELTH